MISMPNALSTPPTPPVPQPAVSDQQQSNAVPGAAPAPSHAETVATIRHMQAIISELRTLMKDPNLGKTDMRSAIIDGAAKLVSSRILTPSEAVQQLSQVPDRPFDQKKWIEQNYMQSVQAISSVLQHHAQSAVGTGNYDLESLMHTSDPDKHQETMRNMLSTHYGAT